MSTDLWDYIDEINNRHLHTSTSSMSTLHDSNIISRILRGSKFIYLKMFDLVRYLLLAETILYYRSKEQYSSYLELCGVCIAMIFIFMIITSIQDYIHRNYMEYEWFHAQNTLPMDIKADFPHRNTLMHMLGMLVFVCGVLPAAYFYFDKPYIANSLLLFVSILGLLKAFEEDSIVWRITIGRRLSVREAGEIYDIVMHNREKDWWQEGGSGQPKHNTLEMRFFLCDALRKDYTQLHTVKKLLELFSPYMSILDRTE